MDRSIRSGGIFGRQRAYRRRLCLSGRLGLMVAALVFVPATVFAKSVEEKPTGYAMMADLLVARPLGVVLAGVSSVFYVVTPPFSLAGGTQGKRAWRWSLNRVVRSSCGVSAIAGLAVLGESLRPQRQVTRLKMKRRTAASKSDSESSESVNNRGKASEPSDAFEIFLSGDLAIAISS